MAYTATILIVTQLQIMSERARTSVSVINSLNKFTTFKASVTMTSNLPIALISPNNILFPVSLRCLTQMVWLSSTFQWCLSKLIIKIL